MSKIALQIELQSPGMVMAGGNVLFDTIVHSDESIDYDSSTGVLAFNQTGSYLLTWWVATQSSASPGTVFTLSPSPGDGTVYVPTFTFLPPPDPLPSGCDTDLITAIQSYLPLGTGVEISLGFMRSAKIISHHIHSPSLCSNSDLESPFAGQRPC